MTIDSSLSWTDQIKKTTSKIRQRIGLLRRISPFLTYQSRLLYFTACIFPLFIHCSCVRAGCSSTLMFQLQKAQKQAARIILGVPFDTPSVQMFARLKWLPINKYYCFKRLCMVFKVLHGEVPTYLSDRVTLARDVHTVRTRFAAINNFTIPRHRTSFYSNFFFIKACQEWNSLPNRLKQMGGYASFRREVVSHLLVQ